MWLLLIETRCRLWRRRWTSNQLSNLKTVSILPNQSIQPEERAFCNVFLAHDHRLLRRLLPIQLRKPRVNVPENLFRKAAFLAISLAPGAPSSFTPLSTSSPKTRLGRSSIDLNFPNLSRFKSSETLLVNDSVSSLSPSTLRKNGTSAQLDWTELGTGFRV